MKMRTLGFAAVVAASISVPSFAHHSHAMFNRDQTLVVTGTVTGFDWTNPHCWLHVSETSDAGQTVEWSLELGSPAQIARRGWRPRTVVPGDVVEVALNPLHEGGSIGALVKITLPDGTEIGEEAE